MSRIKSTDMNTSTQQATLGIRTTDIVAVPWTELYQNLSEDWQLKIKWFLLKILFFFIISNQRDYNRYLG
jgi:hypothetical protein